MTCLTAVGLRDENESERRYDRILEDWEVEGYGAFLARLHQAPNVIGLFTLTRVTSSELGCTARDGAEIGWGITPERRGQKLGVEGARALVECIFRCLAVDVYARCRLENAASMRIISALGMEAVMPPVEWVGNVVFRAAAPGAAKRSDPGARDDA